MSWLSKGSAGERGKMSEAASVKGDSRGTVGEKIWSWGDINPELVDSDICVCTSMFPMSLLDVSPGSTGKYGVEQGSNSLSPGTLWPPPLDRKIKGAVEVEF